jgi:hypothetical protein
MADVSICAVRGLASAKLAGLHMLNVNLTCILVHVCWIANTIHVCIHIHVCWSPLAIVGGGERDSHFTPLACLQSDSNKYERDSHFTPLARLQAPDHASAVPLCAIRQHNQPDN